jgi:hypothetical protein
MTHDMFVINNSYGGYGFVLAQQTIFNLAYDKGIINCCAAGNDGDKGAKYHQMDPNSSKAMQSYPSGYAGCIEALFKKTIMLYIGVTGVRRQNLQLQVLISSLVDLGM